MTILFRWIFVSSLLRIMMIAAAIVAVFIIAESFDKARFIGQGMTFSLLAEYLILKIPFMISDFMPIIVLIAVAIYMTELSHHHELAAMRAAGIAMPVLLQPLLAAAACAGFFTFAMGEWVEPMTNKRLAYIEQTYIQGQEPAQHGVQWLRDGQNFIRLTPLKENYFALMMLKKDNKGDWLERTDASKAYYQQGSWYLEKVFVSKPDANKSLQIEALPNLILPIHVGPETVDSPKPRDMRWLELYTFAKSLADAGLDADDYKFELHKKLAAPLACLIMAILAYSLCGNMGSRIAASSKGMLIAVTLGLVFYVFGSTVSILVDGGELPIIYAVWWPNIMFAGIAGYLLLSKEGY